MISEEMLSLGREPSVIRQIFEYSRKRKAVIGENNVFDFSLGNPSIPSPDKVNEVMQRLIKETPPTLLHGYTSAQGDVRVREKIAQHLKRRCGLACEADNI